MAILNSEIADKAEDLGWKIMEYDDGTVEFSQYSPAGEDYHFAVNAENAAEEIYEYYKNFDVDEHIEMWITAKRNGVGGVPTTCVLVNDAEQISEMLKTLAERIS